MLQTTLWLIIKDWKIFLWEKKRWFAKWVLNGIWWKTEPNESIEECIIRETKEEIWVTITEKEKVGILHFQFEEWKNKNITVHLFKISDYSWKIIETEEIRPFWFPVDKIPYDKMWVDDIHWLPRILNWETNLEYIFYFDSDSWDGKILKHEKIK